MSMEVQVVFKTTLAEEYKVDETQIQLSANSTVKDLTSVLKQLMEHSCADTKGRKFNFMINNSFLTSNLAALLQAQGISNESTVEVYYLFALEKPKPKHTSPQDEWVSAVKSLHHFVNEKAKSYAVGLMNGDLKIYDSKHAELLKVTGLHDETSISDLLYFKSDLIDAGLVVTASEMPNPALTFGQLTQDRKHLNIVGRARPSTVENGISCLAQNPMHLEIVASAGT